MGGSRHQVWNLQGVCRFAGAPPRREETSKNPTRMWQKNDARGNWPGRFTDATAGTATGCGVARKGESSLARWLRRGDSPIRRASHRFPPRPQRRNPLESHFSLAFNSPRSARFRRSGTAFVVGASCFRGPLVAPDERRLGTDATLASAGKIQAVVAPSCLAGIRATGAVGTRTFWIVGDLTVQAMRSRSGSPPSTLSRFFFVAGWLRRAPRNNGRAGFLGYFAGACTEKLRLRH